jgi:hypothetical protein
VDDDACGTEDNYELGQPIDDGWPAGASSARVVVDCGSDAMRSPESIAAIAFFANSVGLYWRE